MPAPPLRLASHFESALSQAVGNLTGREFTVTASGAGAAEVPDDPLIWQQWFSGIADPVLWIAAGRSLWETLARITLEAAGLDSVTEQDARSTWKEILSQTAGAIAMAITADILREVSPANGEEIAAEPPGLVWRNFTVAEVASGDEGLAADDGLPVGGGLPGDEGRSWPIRVAWGDEIESFYEVHLEETRERPQSEGGSKTFDLLLDVSLPVAVSFGRTSLQIREVLKLSTGSIVELNRLVSDPVEVVVNDCVIARGEVVVVDGNYGVRISQLATREDRLRTGMAELPIGDRP